MVGTANKCDGLIMHCTAFYTKVDNRRGSRARHRPIKRSAATNLIYMNSQIKLRTSASLRGNVPRRVEIRSAGVAV